MAVTAWKKIAGTGQRAVSASPGDGELGAAAAAELVRALIGEFHGAAGGRLEHGQPEHALEATVLRGELKVMVGGRALEPLVAPSDPPGSPARSRVARGSQIPAQWWPGGAPRYLDALLRDERTAWAVEMKEPSRAGGYGSYLRHAIGQAVLYRHFLRTASPYGQWFNSAGLDQRGVRALVLYPQPDEVAERKISRRVGDLWLLASAFDVQLVAVSIPPWVRADFVGSRGSACSGLGAVPLAGALSVCGHLVVGSLTDLVPAVAGLLAAEGGDAGGAGDGPSHGGELEALPDDGFAVGLDYTGASEHARGAEGS